MSKGPPSGTPERILLATDLTLACDRAFDRFVQLAKEWKAALTVLHVVEAAAKGLAGVSRRTRDAETEMARLIHAHGSIGDLQIEQRVTLGDPVERIVALSQETQSDLIVTGLAHAKSLSEGLLGSTVAKVLRQTSCPVLSVRSRVFGGYGAVGIGIDFSEPSRAALDCALRLFSGSKFWLVHAYDLPFNGAFYTDYTETTRKTGHENAVELFLSEAMQRFVAEGWEPPRGIQTFHWEGKPPAVFSTFVDIHRPDLVVVGTHGRSGLARLTIGSVAEQLLNTLTCDVLAVPPPTRSST